MKRLLTSLLVASVTLTGCAPHVDIPPDIQAWLEATHGRDGMR